MTPAIVRVVVPGKNKASILFGVRRTVEAIKEMARSIIPRSKVLTVNLRVPLRTVFAILAINTSAIPNVSISNFGVLYIFGKKGRIMMGVRNSVSAMMLTSMWSKILFIFIYLF